MLRNHANMSNLKELDKWFNVHYRDIFDPNKMLSISKSRNVRDQTCSVNFHGIVEDFCSLMNRSTDDSRPTQRSFTLEVVNELPTYMCLNLYNGVKQDKRHPHVPSHFFKDNYEEAVILEALSIMLTAEWQTTVKAFEPVDVPVLDESPTSKDLLDFYRLNSGRADAKSVPEGVFLQNYKDFLRGVKCPGGGKTT